MMIDTHCHLYKEEYDDLELIIDEVEKSNMVIIINGCNKNTNQEAIDLANEYDFIYATIGFHPSEIDSVKESDYLLLEQQLVNNKVVGIGEIGLDYYWNKENKEEQKVMFERQLSIAKKYNKPVIIHSRDAISDTYDILSQYRLNGILHAFSGSLETAKQFIKLGYKLGIGGVLTFKNSMLKDVIKDIDLKYIVLETDSPYLTPEPHRGKKNKPTYVSLVAEKLSKIKGIEYNEVCKLTTSNANSVFDLKLK